MLTIIPIATIGKFTLKGIWVITHCYFKLKIVFKSLPYRKKFCVEFNDDLVVCINKYTRLLIANCSKNHLV